MNRIQSIKNNISSFQNPDEMRREIFNVLSEHDKVPEVGKYYTFIHTPKEKQLIYDQYPLVATMKVSDWGFGGLNFHWKQNRSYSWNSIKSNFHVVKQNELEDLMSLQYEQYRLNNW